MKPFKHKPHTRSSTFKKKKRTIPPTPVNHLTAKPQFIKPQYRRTTTARCLAVYCRRSCGEISSLLLGNCSRASPPMASRISDGLSPPRNAGGFYLSRFVGGYSMYEKLFTLIYIDAVCYTNGYFSVGVVELV